MLQVIQLVSVHGELKLWHLGLEITGEMGHNGLLAQLLQDSVQALPLKLVRLHVGMMVDMDT